MSLRCLFGLHAVRRIDWVVGTGNWPSARCPRCGKACSPAVPKDYMRGGR